MWKKIFKRIGHLLRPRGRRLVKSKLPSWSARWRSSRGNLAPRRISSSHGIFELSREIDVHVGLIDYPTIKRPHEQCVERDPRTNGEPTQARRANDIRHCSRLSSQIWRPGGKVEGEKFMIINRGTINNEAREIGSIGYSSCVDDGIETHFVPTGS